MLPLLVAYENQLGSICKQLALCSARERHALQLFGALTSYRLPPHYPISAYFVSWI